MHLHLPMYKLVVWLLVTIYLTLAEQYVRTIAAMALTKYVNFTWHHSVEGWFTMQIYNYGWSDKSSIEMVNNGLGTRNGLLIDTAVYDCD